MTTRREVVIIGGGASAVLVAAQLSRRAGGPVLLVEAGPEFGAGAVYSTEEPSHLLNSRACVMSALPDDPSSLRRMGAPAYRRHG